jgi:uncharacterized protein YjbI with pentapeptide repeats/beta-lactamase regulating signal transducer with metallopeptidase domain
MIRLEAVEPFARAAAVALGFDLLEAVGLAAIVLAAAAMLRSSATTRHVLWWIALAACAALPVASISSSFGHVQHQAARDSVASGHRRERATLVLRQPLQQRAAERPAAARRGVTDPWAASVTLLERAWSAAAAGTRRAYAATLLVAVWLAVAAIGWTRLALSLLALRRIKGNATPLDQSVVRRLRRWRHSARAGRAVALAVSNEVDVPVAVGFRTPVILLPVGVVENQDIADIDQIAMHEYAHLERYDDWTNLLQRILECALWFNPVATAFIGRRISLEREVACDDWVISQTGRAHRYATCLWKLVESSRLPATRLVAPGALFSPQQITIRIERLLDSRRNALPRLSPLGTLGVGAFALAGAVLAAQHAPAVALTDVPCPVASAARDAGPGRELGIDAGSIAGLEPLLPRTAPDANGAPAAPPRALAAPAVAAHPQAEPARALRAPATAAAPAPPSAAEAEAAARTAVRDAARITADARQHAARDAARITADAQRVVRVALRDGHTASLQEATANLNGAVADAVKWAAATSANAVALADDGDAPPKLDRASLQNCHPCDLRGRDLRGLDLHGISLTSANLQGADLRGANLAGATLAGINLSGARLDDANLSGATLEGSDLHGTSFAGANLDGVRMLGADLREAFFKDSPLRSVVDRCAGCDLRGIDLHGQDLHGVHLDGTDLRGADLRDADLTGAHLSGVDLRDAKLDGASLRNAVLRGCSLHGTDRSRADTTGASIDASND